MTTKHTLTAAWHGYAAALVSVTLWGASFVATRVALQSLTPFGLVAIRLSIGAAVLLIVLRMRSSRLLPTREDRPKCFVLGLILFTHLALQAFGLRYTTAINTGWIMGFIPVLIAATAHMLRRQRVLALGWIGTLVATGGVIMITSARLADFQNARLGDYLQIASCFTWTAYTLAGIGVTARNGAMRVTAAVMIVAALFSWPATAGMGLTIAPMSPASWAALLFLGVLCSGVAFALWFYGLTTCGPARVGALLYLEPFVTSGVSLLLLGEPMTARTLAGAAAVFAGVWMVGHGVIDVPPSAPNPSRKSDDREA